MAIYLLSNTFRTPTRCVIAVGSPWCELHLLSPWLKEATIYRGRQRITVARIHFDMVVAPSSENEAALAITHTLMPGEPIQLSADFGNTREEIMRGFIHTVHTEAASDTARIQVTLTCFDDSARLMGEPVQRVWGGEGAMTDRFIVNAIIREYGFVLDLESAIGSQTSFLMQDDNDWRFLKNRAAANDYELLFQGDCVYFGPRRLEAPPQAPIVVHTGADAHCRYFLLHERVSDTGDGRAEGELDGTHYGHVLRVGEPVPVEARQAAHTSVYYVDAVTDRFTKDTYRQTFQLLSIDSDTIPIAVQPIDQTSLFYQAL